VILCCFLPKGGGVLKGLVVFSFGYRQNESNDPCLSNIDLANAVTRIVREERGAVYVVAQHGVARILAQNGCSNLILTVHRHRQEDQYLDSDEVMAQAAEALRQQGVTQVISVAQPWLHSFKCGRLVRQCGFQLVRYHVGLIRFDRQSQQWWTRSWYQLLWYTIKQIISGHRGSTRR